MKVLDERARRSERGGRTRTRARHVPGADHGRGRKRRFHRGEFGASSRANAPALRIRKRSGNFGRARDAAAARRTDRRVRRMAQARDRKRPRTRRHDAHLGRGYVDSRYRSQAGQGRNRGHRAGSVRTLRRAQRRRQRRFDALPALCQTARPRAKRPRLARRARLACGQIPQEQDRRHGLLHGRAHRALAGDRQRRRVRRDVRVLRRGRRRGPRKDPHARVGQLRRARHQHSRRRRAGFRSGDESDGKPVDVKIYPEAGHAFFDDQRAAYVATAAADAWTRLLAFAGAHLGRAEP